jgi:hypothetical protein
MKKFFVLIFVMTMIQLSSLGQTKGTAARAKPRLPAAAIVPSAPSIPAGMIAGRTYTNRALSFEITFPDAWLVPGSDFVAYMKGKGIDLTPKPPKALRVSDQKKIEADFKRLKILLTAYRSLPGTAQNAVARIAAEDVRELNTNRPVKDAVDYVDLMRSQFAIMKMPASFKYSETQAEHLGPNQFAYIDSSVGPIKTRVYVTVRKNFAILFSLDYVADEDLQTFREVLAQANFDIK